MKSLNKVILTLMGGLISSFSMAQAAEVEMADEMRASGKIYVVVAVLTVIFLGLALYLYLMDRKISNLEKDQG